MSYTIDGPQHSNCKTTKNIYDSKSIYLGRTMDEIANIISGSTDTSTSIDNLLSGSMDPNSALQNIEATSGGFLSGFSFQTIMAGIFMGIIGMYLIKTGKKEGKTVSLLCGLALCIVPYFIQKTSYLIGAGIVLVAIPIVTKN